VRELVWSGPGVCTLEKAALVAELATGVRTDQNERNRGLTTFPGLRFERRQVDVSVVQQLKQRLRTRSDSFVVASSVCIMFVE
jgi:hypothetical protein